MLKIPNNDMGTKPIKTEVRSNIQYLLTSEVGTPVDMFV